MVNPPRRKFLTVELTVKPTFSKITTCCWLNESGLLTKLYYLGYSLKAGGYLIRVDSCIDFHSI